MPFHSDDEPLSSVQLEIRQRWEAERRRLVELKVQERDRKRHRRKLVAEWLKDWSRPREDLLCEDHQVSGGRGWGGGVGGWWG